MAVTCNITTLPILETNFQLDNWAARGLKLVTGWLSLGASGTSSAGGQYCTISTLQNKLYGCIIEPASGFHFVYNMTDYAVKAQYIGATSSSTMTDVASAIDLSGYASVPFLAWGT